jgi:hypothetical protein
VFPWNFVLAFYFLPSAKVSIFLIFLTNVVERFLWFVCHCCALTVASVMIFATWRRYQESPTVTAVETTHFPLWKMPFPAVTVCEPNQVTATSARRLAQRL